MGSETDRSSLTKKLSRYAWGLPCEVALNLLDGRAGAQFLEQLIMIDGELARRAFESQNEQDQKALTELLISETINAGEPDTAQLNRIAVNLPSPITVQTLIDQSKICDVKMDVPIAKAISALVVEHGPVVIASRSGLDFGQVISERRLGIVTAAVKRAINQLMAWSNSRNDFVSLYSAKGLWEFERGLATETLRRLWKTSPPEVVSSVKDVMEELGVE